MAASLALVGMIAFGLAGCDGRSTQDKIVGKWVTGHGDTAGYMEFTKDGAARMNVLPPVEYKIVGENLYTIENGKSELAGHIVWITDDRFTYTVLCEGCRGVAVTYDRVR